MKRVKIAVLLMAFMMAGLAPVIHAADISIGAWFKTGQTPNKFVLAKGTKPSTTQICNNMKTFRYRSKEGRYVHFESLQNTSSETTYTITNPKTRLGFCGKTMGALEYEESPYLATIKIPMKD